MKKLPVGIESFEEFITENFYYVDKTRLIADLLGNWGKVNLFTRPRRFGKSLNMSMLKSFFEIGGSPKLFSGLAIEKEEKLCADYMGKYPVIFVSLKSVNGEDFGIACAMLRQIINDEANRLFRKVSVGQLNEYEQSMAKRLLNNHMSDADMMNSLRILSDILYQYYGKKVIILIDEYDVPLAKAFEQGYYEQMVLLIRNLFEQALKSNESLYFAVLTGCLRISRESIFTGLNNMNILTIDDVEFDEYFGFTEPEVKELLTAYGLSEYFETMQEWYDGYRFGRTDVYCPWDVICYCRKLLASPDALPEEFWSNTSGNHVIRRFIEMAKPATRREIEQLVNGEPVIKEIRHDLTYKELYDSIDNLWSVLYMTGYLTQKSSALDRTRYNGKLRALTIPNREIWNIFQHQIVEWFHDLTAQDGAAIEALSSALENGNAADAEILFGNYLKKTISIRDTFTRKAAKENFYHGILLGLLGFKETWIVTSNQESGDGYSDILIEIDEKELGIVIELKYAEEGRLDLACQTALRQIAEKRYEEKLFDMGMKTVLRYGIGCWKKKCRVMKG